MLSDHDSWSVLPEIQDLLLFFYVEHVVEKPLFDSEVENRISTC